MLSTLTVFTVLALSNLYQFDGHAAPDSLSKQTPDMVEVEFVAPTPSDKTVMSFPATRPFSAGDR